MSEFDSADAHQDDHSVAGPRAANAREFRGRTLRQSNSGKRANERERRGGWAVAGQRRPHRGPPRPLAWTTFVESWRVKAIADSAGTAQAGPSEERRSRTEAPSPRPP